MTKRGISVGVALAVFFLITAGSASAVGPNKCASAKLKATGKKAQDRAKCFSKAVQKGISVDPACIGKASLKFSTAFGKAEAKGPCIAPNGDESAMESKVDTFVDNIRSIVNSSAAGPNTCDSKKIFAAGKKAAAKEKCQAKAVAKGTSVDPLCISKAESKFSSAISKAETTNQGPCTNTGQTGSLESAVDSFVNDADGELETPTTTTTTSTTSTSTTSTSTTTTSTTTLSTTTTTHTTTTTTHTTTTTTHTTTTTTTTSTTTTTLLGSVLKFKTAPGTTSCGSAAFNPNPASAPTNGQLFSDTACSTMVSGAALGRGCLYFGGGKATIVAGGLIPDGATSTFTLTGATTLGPNAGTGRKDCTNGAGPGKHCVNGHCNSDANCGNVVGACQAGVCNAGTQTSPLVCSTDTDCGGSATSCQPDANCFFGPPLPIPAPPPNDALTTCVQNVVQTNASGTYNAGTGDSNVTLPLGSRVYITGNSTDPCPRCISGTCDNTWVDVNSSPGEDNGKACTTDGVVVTTSLDCRPPLGGYQANLPVNLSPLTTGSASASGRTCVADSGCGSIVGSCVGGVCNNGLFCAAQTVASAGAFGQPTARCIQETGSAAGNLSDHAAHQSIIASVFCIPKTGNVAVDGVANLPGPGAIAINGTAQVP